ncbi:MAG: SGNH/GDSL hydrolase family protein [Bryobacteraceae bacterium]|nr:SGNH/GDSL hydrolase family protein [Bryobacteraceae bacterium]
MRVAAALCLLLLVLSAVADGARPKKKRTRRTPSKRPAAVHTVPAPLPETALENEGALVPFFELLHQLERGERSRPVRVLHYGDSHTAADEWTGTLRTLLQGKFGDGGPGFVHAGRPWNSFRRKDAVSRASRRWYTDGLFGRKGDGLYGLAGVAITAARTGEWVSLEADFQTLELWFLKQPGGGSVALTADGVEFESVSTDGLIEPGYAAFDFEPGRHTLRLETADHAPVRLFGWVGEKGPGVTYETLGINGFQAAMQAGWDTRLLREHIRRRDPALIVLAYGTNEAGSRDLDYQTCREQFGAVLKRLREAAPAAAILVVGPPDRYFRQRRKWIPLPGLDRVIRAQRDAAAEHGCAFWDQRAKMGGTGTMPRWVRAGLAQRDHVHMTGAGYRRLGEMLFGDLMEPYLRFVEARPAAPTKESNGNGPQKTDP